MKYFLIGLGAIIGINLIVIGGQHAVKTGETGLVGNHSRLGGMMEATRHKSSSLLHYSVPVQHAIRANLVAIPYQKRK